MNVNGSPGIPARIDCLEGNVAICIAKLIAAQESLAPGVGLTRGAGFVGVFAHCIRVPNVDLHAG